MIKFYCDICNREMEEPYGTMYVDLREKAADGLKRNVSFTGLDQMCKLCYKNAEIRLKRVKNEN